MTVSLPAGAFEPVEPVASTLIITAHMDPFIPFKTPIIPLSGLMIIPTLFATFLNSIEGALSTMSRN